MYRTIAKKVFWEFDSIIMQNLSDILPLFCTPTWPSHHVSENQELGGYQCRCVVKDNKNSKKSRCLKMICAGILLNTLSVVNSIQSPCVVFTLLLLFFFFLSTRIALKFILTPRCIGSFL